MRCKLLHIGWFAMLYFVAFNALKAQTIIVASDGSGDFKTIQGAINSLSKHSNKERKIFIKSGNYNEKIYIEKEQITLIGADKATTIITEAISRDEWRCLHNDDWGVATLNVGANNTTLQNLTIINSFGFEFAENYTIPCPLDTVSGKKIVTRNGHQMALRTMFSTKLKAINCRFRSWGGDTVSPWETENGMWYFKGCTIEGGVDFYCPRGWAWAEDCDFIAHNGAAAIWHDGSKHESAKSVFKNCRFSGYDGFLLGRYHRDAQFYLIDCVFADNMLDSAIYRVPTNNIIRWGHRAYFFNCKRMAGNFDWFQNNISNNTAKSINSSWVFQGKWNPE